VPPIQTPSTPLLVETHQDFLVALQQANTQNLPLLICIWAGESLRTDLRTALDKAAKENTGRFIVIKADAGRDSALAARYEVGKHPLLLGIVGNEILFRRSRPWDTDVPTVVEALLKHAPAAAPVAAPPKQTVITGKTVAVFDNTFEAEVLQSELPVLIDFWADWCQPCKMVAPILDKLAKEFAGQIKIAKVDTEKNPTLSATFRIQSIPLLMFVKGGRIVGQQAGALPEHVLRDAIKQLIALKVPA
jgi:thioredoxin 1